MVTSIRENHELTDNVLESRWASSSEVLLCDKIPVLGSILDSFGAF